MEKLSYQLLKQTGYTGYILPDAPEKVMQFGEGNFLRGFVDYWFDMANEKAGWNGKNLVVKPIPDRPGFKGACDVLNEQDCLYTLYLRGRENGQKVDRKRIISSISRCIDPYTEEGFQAMLEAAASDDLRIVVSNTTEAGITYDPSCKLEDRPASSYPGKLTQVLYARFQAKKPGLIIMACELIDDNGKKLRQCVLQYAQQWSLGEAFQAYVEQECRFCSTLVDRIVSGKVRDPQMRQQMEQENGYVDDADVVGEIFGVWNIEGDAQLESELPFKAAGVNCPVVPAVAPYKKRKVHILNGAHTSFVPGAYVAGFDIVRQCMENDTIRTYMNNMLYQEVIPTLPLDKQDLMDFAAAVEDRFNNPFVDHALLSISLNSTSKWKERVLPSLLNYVREYKQLPKLLAFSLAGYLSFYTTNVQDLTDEGLVCRRSDGTVYTCNDDAAALKFFYAHKDDGVQELVHAAMTNVDFWGMDLTQVDGLEAVTVENLARIRQEGPMAAFAAVI